MKVLNCWLLAALSVCGAVSAGQLASHTTESDWDYSENTVGADASYTEGTVHALDNAKQSSPASSSNTIGAEATVSPGPSSKATTPKATPSATKPKVTAPKATPSASKPKVTAPKATPSASKPSATRTPVPAPISSSDASSSGNGDDATSTDGSDAGDSGSGSSTNSTSSGGFLQPFSTAAPSETLFKRNAGLSKMAPIINVAQDIITKGERPIPTNKWWGNLIHTTEKDRDTLANPAWSNPYAIKLPVKEAPFGLQACYSYTYRKEAPLKDGKIRYYLHEHHNDLTLSAQEFTAKPSYEIYDWSDLGASLRICTSAADTAASNCMESSIVNGMAFISSKYDGLTPKIVSEYAITKLTQGDNGKYVIELQNKQTWVLYTSSAATFKIDATGKAIAASAAYTGSLRIAVLPDSASANVYDDFASCTVLGGTISVESRTKYSFNWAVDGTSCDSKGLLHFAFQHQIDSMGSSAKSANSTDTITLQSTVRGAMAGQVARNSGSSSKTIKWSLSEPELTTEIDFYPPRKPSASTAAQIKTELEKDIASDWTLAKDGSYYFNGKAYQKYASLCLMAADASIVGTDTSLKTTCVTKLEALIEPFLTNTWTSPLVYETSYRGVISSQLFTANNVDADFGNGVYNDHHYHYGYWVTASAMLKKLDPTWTRMAELETMVWTLLRDVANPSAEDKFFPTFRHFSWFLGHSYSHGVTPMADGKDQESTSEDINFLYGMMLWGKVSGRKAVEDLGSLMLRIDARAVRTYFLMDSDNALHPPEFVRNHVTGIFFDNKVDYATWFSAEKYCIHGIQMIPVSPINEIVRSAKFVQEEWDDILSKESVVLDASSTDAWLSLLYVNYATIDQSAALARLAKVKMDDGLTRSWAMYNAATRATTGGVTTQTPSGTPKATPAPAATQATASSPSPTPTPSSAAAY